MNKISVRNKEAREKFCTLRNRVYGCRDANECGECSFYEWYYTITLMDDKNLLLGEAFRLIIRKDASERDQGLPLGDIVENQEKFACGKAESVHGEILDRTGIKADNILELGKLFKSIKDDKLYLPLGAETFDEYCGFSEIHFTYKEIASFIHVYELSDLKLNRDMQALVDKHEKAGNVKNLKMIDGICKALGIKVYMKGYFRKNGTYVSGH